MPPSKRHVAVGADDQQASGVQLSRQELQEQERRRVSPVEVVENDDERLGSRSVLQDGCDAVEEAESGLLGLQDRRRRQRQPLAYLGHQLRDVGRTDSELSEQGFRVPILHVGANDLDPWPEGRNPRGFVATAPEHSGTPQPGVSGEHVRRAGLADAGLARQQNHPASAREGIFQAGAKLGEFPLAVDEDAGVQPVQDVPCSLGHPVADADRTGDRCAQYGPYGRRARGPLLRRLAQQPQDERL